MIEFADTKKSKQAIKRTWDEFRNGLAEGLFTYKDIDKAKKSTFLKVYDELFRQYSGIIHLTKTISEIIKIPIGRGTKLKEMENPGYERFIPKEKFITEDNRFSPPGMEWLYLTIGNPKKIRRCAIAECRAISGDRFGFCRFSFDPKYSNYTLVDLTISDDISYEKINQILKNFYKSELHRNLKATKKRGYFTRSQIDREKFVELFTKWNAYTYTKLLAEQIFIPLTTFDDRAFMYAPFQTMAQYYKSLGYSGIIYKSTVCQNGRNIVLFDKQIASPSGEIEIFTV